MKTLLLEINAYSGCDTTSAIFESGKPTFLKKTENSKELLKLLRKRSCPRESKDPINSAGQKIFIHCHDGRSSDKL